MPDHKTNQKSSPVRSAGTLFPEWQELWFVTKDCDPAAYQIMKRHYTFQEFKDGRRSRLSNPNRYSFIGPGGKMILVTNDYSALFAWRKFINDDGQTGINCAVFRNEGNLLSSLLIIEAEKRAWERWPGERLYTYVNSKKIKSTNPGFCFKMAGWKVCGKTKKGLIILEKYP